MRKVLFLLVAVLAQSSVAAQTVNYNELNQIIELYTDGQYAIVKAKLKNDGFNAAKSTPDYSLHGTQYKGDFEMKRSLPGRDPKMREMTSGINLTEDSWWEFKTTDDGTFSEASISFRLIVTEGALLTYQNLVSKLTSEIGRGKVGEDSPDRKSVEFSDLSPVLGRNPSKPDAVFESTPHSYFGLSYGDATFKFPSYSGPHSEYISGVIRLKLANKPISKADYQKFLEGPSPSMSKKSAPKKAISPSRRRK